MIFCFFQFSFFMRSVCFKKVLDAHLLIQYSAKEELEEKKKLVLQTDHDQWIFFLTWLEMKSQGIISTAESNVVCGKNW